MWDENYQKKPAYSGFLKGIQSGKGRRPVVIGNDPKVQEAELE